MWLYTLTWLTLPSIKVAAAICFGVASFAIGQELDGTLVPAHCAATFANHV